MPHNIPPATLAAGDQSDPAWWLACAEWHEGWAEAALLLTEQERAYNSAAALACRTFATMMARKADAVTARADDVAAFWVLNGDGSAYAFAVHGILPRSLPAAAVAALQENPT
jgi:hypothetical protein